MAEENTTKENTNKDENQPEEQPKKSRLKWIILGVLIIVAGAGAFAGWTFFLKDKTVAADKGAGGETAAVRERKEAQGKVICPLGSFIVNLANENSVVGKYLKATIELELGAKEEIKLIENYKPELKDMIIMLLSTKSSDDIRTMEGKLALKQSLVVRINQVLRENIVRRVYFTEFVVQ